MLASCAGISHGAGEDWRTAAEARIRTHRQGDFTLTVTDATGQPAVNQPVTINLYRHHFLFGTAVNTDILTKPDSPTRTKYLDFIRTYFSGVVDENTMKWYSTEKEAGKLTYAGGDAFVAFAQENKLKIRGHCLFWAKPKFTQPWVQALNDQELKTAVTQRLDSAVTRYRGKLVSWDVNNEMLDGSFFADRLGKKINAWFFSEAARLDPQALPFVNEYGILADDQKTQRYLDLIADLQRDGAVVGGIGIQEHAAERCAHMRIKEDRSDDPVERQSNLELEPAAMLKRLDKIGALKLPIHLTEISFKTADEERKAEALDTFYTMGFSHPNVEAILMWGFWAKSHWLGRAAALVDEKFELLPAGKRYVELLTQRWHTHVEAVTDAQGKVSFRGFYGTYDVKVGTQKLTTELLPAHGQARLQLQ